MTYTQLNKKYLQLLDRAEKAEGRKEAVRIIHEADAIRIAMSLMKESREYPLIHTY